MQRPILLRAVLSVAVLAGCPIAVAYMKIDYPVSRMYGMAGYVVVGTIVGVRAHNRVLDVKAEQTVKGESVGDQLRVQIASPPELIDRVAVDQPLVIFGGGAGDGGKVVLHMADTWLVGERIPNVAPPAWRVLGVMNRKEFPGRTVALVRLVADLKAGRSTLLEKPEKKVSKTDKSTVLKDMEDRVFRPEIRELAKLNANHPTWLSAMDVNGDRKPDLLVGTPEGARLFLATAGGYEDATDRWGLAGAKGAGCAWADVNADGRADLLLDATLWINVGQRFAPAKAEMALPDQAAPLAAALSDLNGDRRPDALVLLANGGLHVFANPGGPAKTWTAEPVRQLWADQTPALAAAFGDWGDNGRPHVMVVRPDSMTRYALDADGGPPADFARLTAAGWPTLKRLRAPLKGALAATIDSNGDCRPDLLLVTGRTCFLLVNRGFGCYLVSSGPASALIPTDQHAVPFNLGPATPITSCDLHGRGFQDLLVLTEDGHLYGVDNDAAHVRGGGALRRGASWHD